jgi:hypothetical protein
MRRESSAVSHRGNSMLSNMGQASKAARQWLRSCNSLLGEFTVEVWK